MKYLGILIFIVFACGQQTSINQRSEKMYEKMRLSMVEEQIKRRGVKDESVLVAMREVPRHEFVPDHLKKYAYADEPLPIGEDQTISQPYIVAYMTEYLRLEKEDKVLEIGTGSGYQTAVLAHVAAKVYSIEVVPELAESASDKLHALGYDNAYTRLGDGHLGWADEAPFNAIMITAAPTVVPRSLIDQLAPLGRLVVPLGAAGFTQKLMRIEKDAGGAVHSRTVLPVSFVPMRGR